MDEPTRRVDEFRRTSSEIENHLVDELSAGKISRREFVRRGTVLGLSLPALSFIAAACGGDDDDDAAATGATDTTGGSPQAGGTLRTALISPAGALDPLTVGDEGGLAVLGQSGEYLAWSDDELMLQPRIAESWEPNEDGSVWTFAIRQGVTFHDGQPLSAEDVVATMEYHLGNESNALSALTGVLSAGNTQLVDEATVEFTLDAPNGNFPYLLSSDNYNLIILPKTFTGDWEGDFIGTGPWMLETYTPEVGATYAKNPNYWDTSRMPLADKSEVKFYEDEQARVLALQGGEVDIVSNFSVAGGGALLEDPSFTVIEIRAAQHRKIHMRTDMEPFQDKRVRQAMALAIDRQAMVDGLFEGKADLGNDSPFAPVFPSTDPSVPQRAQDLEQARQLLQAAGKGDGFTVTLESWQGFEIPDLAVLVQNALAEIGVTVELQITDALARLALRDHRLGAPRRAERAPFGGARERGAVECPALQEPAVRRPADRLRGRVRPRLAARGRQADPGAAARRDAGHLPLLLLPPGGNEERRRGRADRHGPLRPQPGRVRHVAEIPRPPWDASSSGGSRSPSSRSGS
jgi:peptide/nickel transport system substrate-binding protein